jgi:sarcosine oxidase delta subunit
MPETYQWPNEDDLYCLSYCPLHPGVHTVVFALVDEIMNVFEAKTFHAGLDEVFYIGDDKCPRCRGKDKAELFAGEVRLIRDHLAMNDQELWIWGDRLIDGATTGLGMWEASMNNTHRAIDMIPKDVVICDWHYERADPTAVYFAMKGFRVITCPYRKPDVAIEQMNNLIFWRQNSTSQMSEKFMGMMQTVWSGASSYMNQFYGKSAPRNPEENSVTCFKELFEEMNKLK